MNNNDFNKRRCHQCRNFFPKCDLNNHKIYGYICKKCYDLKNKNL